MGFESPSDALFTKPKQCHKYLHYRLALGYLKKPSNIQPLFYLYRDWNKTMLVYVLQACSTYDNQMARFHVLLFYAITDVAPVV